MTKEILVGFTKLTFDPIWVVIATILFIFQDRPKVEVLLKIK